jgi:hypothetical protein
MLPVYGGKVLSRKAVHNWVEKFSQGRSKVADDETEVRQWLREQSKNFYATGFDALVKRWDKFVNVDGEYVVEYIFFFSFEYHIFYVLYPFVIYLLTLPRSLDVDSVIKYCNIYIHY